MAFFGTAVRGPLAPGFGANVGRRAPARLAAMLPRVRLAAALLCLVAGCRDDEAAAPAEEGPRPIPTLQAAELHRSYSTMSGADLLREYGSGVTVTGTVQKRIDAGGSEGVQLRLAAGPPGHVLVRFHDGPALRKRKFKTGEVVTVTCQIGGKPADVLFLVDCALP